MSDLDNTQTLEAFPIYGNSGVQGDATGVRSTGSIGVSCDKFARLETMSEIYTTRNAFREDFVNLGGNLTGTTTITSGSTAVTGSGTVFTSELRIGMYVKGSAEAETGWRQVKSIESDTALTLEASAGSSTSGTALGYYFAVETPSGGSITNPSNSLIALAAGTSSGVQGALYRAQNMASPRADYCRATLSQRIANQTFYIGFMSTMSAGVASRKAVFSFSGTTNTQVDCISSNTTAVANTQTTTVKLPSGATTASYNDYRIILTNNAAKFYINDVLVATHTQHIPEMYYSLRSYVVCYNSGVPASGTTLTFDTFQSVAINHLDITTQLGPIDVQGVVSAENSGSSKTTYSAASTAAVTIAATATDVFTITGSATKTVKVVRMGFSGTQTAGAMFNVYLVKRSTANSGGTSTSLTRVPHDSNDAAATATVLTYTANPTTGTLVGTVKNLTAFVPATTTVIDSSYSWQWTDIMDKPIVLRGTSEVLALNFNSVTMTGGSLLFYVEWVEDAT